LVAVVQEVTLVQVQKEAIPYFQVLHQKAVVVVVAKQVLPVVVGAAEEKVMLELVQVEVLPQELLAKVIMVEILFLVEALQIELVVEVAAPVALAVMAVRLLEDQAELVQHLLFPVLL
jgi:hypothetical protein